MKHRMIYLWIFLASIAGLLLAGCEIEESIFVEDNVVTAVGGGTVSSSSGQVTLEFPPGALTEDTKISIEKANEGSLPGAVSDISGGGAVWRLEPSGLEFLKPVRLTISIPMDDLSDSAMAAGVPAHLLMVVADDGEFEFLEGVEIGRSADGASLTLTGELSHFSWLVMHESVLTVLLELLNPRQRQLKEPFTVTYEIFSEAQSLASLASLIMAANIIGGGDFKISKAEPFWSPNLGFLGSSQSTTQRENSIDIVVGKSVNVFMSYGDRADGTLKFECIEPGDARYGLDVEVMPFGQNTFSLPGNINIHIQPTIGLTIEANLECIGTLPAPSPTFGLHFNTPTPIPGLQLDTPTPTSSVQVDDPTPTPTGTATPSETQTADPNPTVGEFSWKVEGNSPGLELRISEVKPLERKIGESWHFEAEYSFIPEPDEETNIASAELTLRALTVMGANLEWAREPAMVEYSQDLQFGAINAALVCVNEGPSAYHARLVGTYGSGESFVRNVGIIIVCVT